VSNEFFSRKNVLIRFLYTIVVCIGFEVVRFVALLCTLVQYAIVLVTKKESEPLRHFCNVMSRYAYHCLRYMTLNSNERPFPFSQMPYDTEEPDRPVRYGK